MPLRRLKVASTITPSEFAKLLAKWDQRLKRTGFTDLECGDDYNRSHRSTFPRPRGGGHGLEVTLAGLQPRQGLSPDESDTIYDSPHFQIWNDLAHAAHSLPDGWPNKALIIEIAETGELAKAGRKRRLSRWQTSARLKAFCDDEGIDYSKLFRTYNPATPKEVDPPAAPVRRLSVTEIRQLTYTSPKDLP